MGTVHAVPRGQLGDLLRDRQPRHQITDAQVEGLGGVAEGELGRGAGAAAGVRRCWWIR